MFRHVLTTLGVVRTIAVAASAAVAVTVALAPGLTGTVSLAALGDALAGLAGGGLAAAALAFLAGLASLASLAVHAVPAVVHISRVGIELFQGRLQFRHMDGFHLQFAGAGHSSRICKGGFIDGTVLCHDLSPKSSARTAGWS